MRLFVAAVLAIWAIGTSAMGQEALRVRAGEHATYSRLVVPVPPATEWSFTSASRSAELFVPIPGSNFVYDQVFDRIPKTRILSLNAEETEGGAILRLAFACACEANASVSGRYLVIDIGDPKEPETATTGGNDVAEILEASPPPTNGPEPSVTASAPRPRPTPPEAEIEASDNPPNDVADQLISQLERAAEQGLVDLKKERDPAPPRIEAIEGAEDQPDTPPNDPQKYRTRTFCRAD